jgi:hypothetical protein
MDGGAGARTPVAPHYEADSVACCCAQLLRDARARSAAAEGGALQLS